MNNDLISIIIPTYNRKKSIVKSIKSILNQTYSNIEVIVVDDASTDNTKDVIKKIKDKRLKYYKLRTNHGACYARNYGVSKANGTYVSFNDSDDIYLPSKIELQFKNLLKNKSDMDFSKLELFDGDKRLVVPTKQQLNDIKNSSFIDTLCNGNYISTQTIFIKKDIFNKFKFDETLPRLQDFDFVLRVVSNVKVSYTDVVLNNVYRSIDSISNDNKKLENTSIKMLKKA